MTIFIVTIKYFHDQDSYEYTATVETKTAAEAESLVLKMFRETSNHDSIESVVVEEIPIAI